MSSSYEAFYFLQTMSAHVKDSHAEYDEAPQEGKRRQKQPDPVEFAGSSADDIEVGPVVSTVRGIGVALWFWHTRRTTCRVIELSVGP